MKIMIGSQVFSNTFFGRGLSWVQTEKAIFVFVKNTLPPTAALMSAIYEEHTQRRRWFSLHDLYSGERTHLAPPKMQEPSL
ncbi:unnamed protein product [Musa hybrid cultivar]